jgi:hypothetical protein
MTFHLAHPCLYLTVALVSLLLRLPGNLKFPGLCSPKSLVNSVFVFSCLSIEKKNYFKTFNNGSLGSGIDEERSEMR